MQQGAQLHLVTPSASLETSASADKKGNTLSRQMSLKEKGFVLNITRYCMVL